MKFFEKFHHSEKPEKNATNPVTVWRLTISGRVQGVGFRFSVDQLARAMNLTGSVCNNLDQTVTVELQADKQTVDKFIAALPHNLTPVAQISHISVEKTTKMKQIHGFHVLY